MSFKCKSSLLDPFLQTFKLFEKLAVQDRETVMKMKLAEEARAVPAALEEIEVQSQPQEPVQESMSTEASSTEQVSEGAACADGNEAKMQAAEREEPTAPSAASAVSEPSAPAPSASASAPSASAPSASAPVAGSESSAVAS